MALDEATKEFVLVGCEVDDHRVITYNDAACIARFKKMLMDDNTVADWERIASFLGVNMDYDLDSGVMATEIKSKMEKLFEHHSIKSFLKNVKAPSPITEENLNVPSVYKEKWAPVDHYIADKYASINGALGRLGTIRFVTSLLVVAPSLTLGVSQRKTLRSPSILVLVVNRPIRPSALPMLTLLTPVANKGSLFLAIIFSCISV